jgi:hypothetical protein
VKRRKKEVLIENRARLNEYKATHPCVDCGEADPIVLEFDHVAGKKRMELSRMLTHGCSWETIMSEIAKCVMRCANCHRRKTFRMHEYRKKNQRP